MPIQFVLLKPLHRCWGNFNGKKTLFWANFRLRTTLLGVKTPLGPLTKILDPRLLCHLMCKKEVAEIKFLKYSQVSACLKAELLALPNTCQDSLSDTVQMKSDFFEVYLPPIWILKYYTITVNFTKMISSCQVVKSVSRWAQSDGGSCLTTLHRMILKCEMVISACQAVCWASVGVRVLPLQPFSIWELLCFHFFQQAAFWRERRKKLKVQFFFADTDCCLSGAIFSLRGFLETKQKW